MAVKPKELDAREARFVDEYMLDLNPERAAVAAGYTLNTAKSKSFSWVGNSRSKPHVFAEVQKRKDKLAEKKAISAERVIAEIAKVGFASMRRFVTIDADGQPQINLTDTPDDDLDALSEIQTETVLERDGTDDQGNPQFNRVRKTKIKLYDKLNALEKLAQHTGVYAKRDENIANAFVKAVAEIQARTSRAPIARDDADTSGADA